MKSLLNELKAFRKKEKISMHIPGHKNGRGLGAYFTKNAFDIDVTEVSGTDNLQNPDGILKDAQQNCAKIFGARETYFLTGGSSLGIRAAILGTTKRGEKLLVDRACHRSVLDAVVLGGIEPVFITRDFVSGVYTGITKEAVADVLSDNPDIKGMIITSPTYYGIVSDIRGIKEVLDNRFLIVDEAHGAHFVFSEKLPDTALSMGADICVQSAHKTLPALGQSSYLHIGNTEIDTNRFIKMLRMLQSTSPSYMLMTSLDEAARYMNSTGRNELKRLICEIEKLKNKVKSKTSIRFLESTDKTRIVADFSKVKRSGHSAEKILAEKFGIYAEMSDFRYVVFIPSIINTNYEIKQLAKALIYIGRIKDRDIEENIPLPQINLEMLPSEAFEKETETVSVKDATGRVSAEVVSACPPGAAVVVPGQKIDKSVIDYITKNKVCERISVIR